MNPLLANENLARLIKAGVEWLQAEQPEQAVISQHGIYSKNLDMLYGFSMLTVAPVAFSDHVSPVLVFEREPVYAIPKDYFSEVVNKFTIAEIRAINDHVSQSAKIKSGWNGVGRITYSIALQQRAGASIWHAYGNYKAGCPHHERHKQHFCTCPDWSARFQLITLPTYGEWGRS